MGGPARKAAFDSARRVHDNCGIEGRPPMSRKVRAVDHRRWRGAASGRAGVRGLAVAYPPALPADPGPHPGRGTGRPGGSPAGPLRGAARLCAHRRGPVLRPGLRARPGPLLADGVLAADQLRAPVRAVRQVHPGDRQVPAHPGRVPRGPAGVRAAVPGHAPLPGGLRRRGQRLHPEAPARPPGAGVRPAEAAGGQGAHRALDPGGLHRLGQDDGLRPGRQTTKPNALHLDVLRVGRPQVLGLLTSPPTAPTCRTRSTRRN